MRELLQPTRSGRPKTWLQQYNSLRPTPLIEDSNTVSNLSLSQEISYLLYNDRMAYLFLATAKASSSASRVRLRY